MLNKYIAFFLISIISISLILSGCNDQLDTNKINKTKNTDKYEYLSNKNCGFKIKYSQNINTKVGQFESDTGYFDLSIYDENINLACSYLIQLPIIEQNTNLNNKALAIIFMHNPSDLSKFVEDKGVIKELNNKKYYFRSSVDAGMSKQVIYNYYQPNGDNTNPIIITSLFSTEPDVYEQPPREYNKNLESEVFFEILDSYNKY